MKIVNRLLLMGAAAVAASIAKKNMDRKAAEKDLWATATDNVGTIPPAGGAAWQGAAQVPGSEAQAAAAELDEATSAGVMSDGSIAGETPEPARGDAWGQATDHL